MLIIDNVLPAPLWKKVLEWSYRIPMTYGSKSNSVTDPHGHWSYKPLHDKKQNISDLSGSVRSVIPLIGEAWDAVSQHVHLTDCKLIRCYVNGYTFGTDGYFHTDSHRSDELTAMLYLCPSWDKDWAGETLVANGNGFDICMPAPNRLVVFPSNVPHCGRAVSRKCEVLRQVLVLKTRKPRPSPFEELSSWLVASKALDLPHKDGSLHDHLMRCVQLAHDHKLSPSVVLGCGLHSIYGTAVYKNQLFRPTPEYRTSVAQTWGAEAEALAYWFSILDRPKALNDIGMVADKPMSIKMIIDQYASVPPVTARNLQLIECVNLLDQNSLSKWDYLSKLWESLK